MSRTAKHLVAIALSVLLTGALVPAAWATGNSVDEVVATPGWEVVGTCEWRISDSHCLEIRPSGNGSAGAIFSNDGLWPWDYELQEGVTSIKITGKVICEGDMTGLFDGFSHTEFIEGLLNFDTSHATKMNSMFAGCESLTTLDLSGFDTAQVESMESMFKDCASLTSINLRNFDTSNVIDMSCMFVGASSLSTLDVSSFDVSSVELFSSMFAHCSSLTELDLSCFVTSSATSFSGMLDNCSRLTELNLANFDTRLASNDEAVAGDNMFSWSPENYPPLDLVIIGENFTLQNQLPDKTWYNEAGESFTPATIPRGIAGAYATSTDLLEPLRVAFSEKAKIVHADTDPFTLVVAVTPEWRNGPIAWSSSDSSVATVDTNGVVTVHKVGSANISAEVEGAKDTCTLTVVSADSGGSDGDSDSDGNDDPNGDGDGDHGGSDDANGNGSAGGTDGSGGSADTRPGGPNEPNGSDGTSGTNDFNGSNDSNDPNGNGSAGSSDNGGNGTGSKPDGLNNGGDGGSGSENPGQDASSVNTTENAGANSSSSDDKDAGGSDSDSSNKDKYTTDLSRTLLARTGDPATTGALALMLLGMAGMLTAFSVRLACRRRDR